MKKIFTLFLLLASMFGYSQSTTLVISQFYGAGGNTGATLNADYVELHNISAVAQSTAGFSIQYASAANTGVWTGVSALPAASIPPGGYYLIQMSSTGATGSALPTPDYVSNPTIAMSGTSGKVALVNGVAALSGCPAATAVIDLVGYGTANCSETAPTAVLTPTTGGIRNNNGCTETNNNLSDFTLGTPAPRNSASPVFICGGPVGPTITTTALTAFGNVCINTTLGPNSFVITGTDLTTADIVVGPLTGYTFSATSGGTYTSTLTIMQAGGSVTQSVFVNFTPTSIASFNGNIPVTGGGISATVNVAAVGSGVNVAPSVTTGMASGITTSTATLAGSIPSSGCTAVSAYGIEYSLVNGFTPGTGTIVPSGNLAGNNFTAGLSGLTGSTTYYYIAYATNAGGTGYGTQMSFITAPPITPTLSSSGLTAFGDVCVNVTAGPNSLNISGSNLTVADIIVGPLSGYSFSLTAGGTYTSSLTLTQTGGTFSQTVFVQFTPTAVISYNGDIPVTGAGAPSIIVAVTGNGVNAAPGVTTGGATSITSNSATLGGSIPSAGCTAVTTYGIEYSVVNGFSNGTGTAVASTNLAGSNYTSGLTGLTAATTYYYKAYATNAGGTTYGLQQTFTTVAPPPAVLSATGLIGFGDVCINLTVGPNSFDISGVNLLTTDIVVGPLEGYTFSTTETGTYTNSLTITQTGGSITQSIFVKFSPVAQTSYIGYIPVTGAGAPAITVPVTGNGITSPPFVLTGDSLLVTPNIVITGGVIGDIGCSPVIEYGIEYSGVNGFNNGSGTKVPSNDIAADGKFSSQLAGLVQNTAYYYKAYAVNSGGIAYGEQKSFITGPIPAGLIIYNVPIVRGTNLHYSLSGIKPGHYAVRIFNSMGQLVFQRDMIVQVDFIDDNFIFPAKLPMGLYTLQVFQPGFNIQKPILVQ